MQQSKILGVSVDVACHQVEQRRADEAITFGGWISCRIRNPLDRCSIKAAAVRTVPLILEPSWKPERLGKVLLMQADDAPITIMRTVEPLHQQSRNATLLDDLGFDGLKSQLTRRSASQPHAPHREGAPCREP